MNCTELWQSIIVSIVTSTFYLLVLMVIYGLLSRKLEKQHCEQKARRQNRLKEKNPNSALTRKLFDSKETPCHQQELVSHWLSDLQVQRIQGPNVKINNRIPGSSSENSQRSCTRENSGSDDVNYTTINFKGPVHSTTTGRDNEDINVKENYENVVPYSCSLVPGSKDTTKDN